MNIFIHTIEVVSIIIAIKSSEVRVNNHSHFECNRCMLSFCVVNAISFDHKILSTERSAVRV